MFSKVVTIGAFAVIIGMLSYLVWLQYQKPKGASNTDVLDDETPAPVANQFTY